MEKVVRRTIKQYELLSEGEGVVVGFSGGADSSALLFVLNALKEEYLIKLVAVHVHHGIRGQEADHDAKKALDMCEALNIPCYVFEEDVPTLAKSKNMSLEQAGRWIRYRRFEEVRMQLGYQKIALAHHRDDQSETMLFRMMRGSGLEGILGMAYKREDGVIRPLLGVSRKMIEAYCQYQNIDYVTDTSNLESEYSRNFIRLEIVPALEERFGVDLGEKFSELSQRLRSDLDFIEKSVEKAWYEGIMESDGTFIVKSKFLKENPEAISSRLIRQIVLKLCGRRDDFSQVHVAQMMQLAESGGYRKVVLHGVCCESSQGILKFRLEKTRKRESNLSPPELRVERFEVDPPEGIEALKERLKRIPADQRRWTILVDAKKIKGPLVLRHRKPEDRFSPLGLKGHKKVKDFFIDEKIPKEIRDEVWLLCDEEKIIWICGYRSSEAVRLSEESREILQLTLSDIVREH